MIRFFRTILPGLAAAIFCSVLAASPPSYRVEFLDTGQFAAPSALLPQGGYLGPVAQVSDNGRFVLTQVFDVGGSGIDWIVGLLDLETGAADLIPELSGRFYPLGVNNDGAVIVSSPPSVGGFNELYYWSAATGAIGFGGPSLPTRVILSENEVTGKILNNFNQVLVRASTGDHLIWDPVTDDRIPIVNDDPSFPGNFDAISLNDLGQVVGTVFGLPDPTAPNREDSRGFIWDALTGMRILDDPGLMTPDMGPFIDFGRRVHATAINNSGRIVCVFH